MNYLIHGINQLASRLLASVLVPGGLLGAWIFWLRVR
jgi:hypothetical protein